ncbi:conjugal transfer protein TraQ, partial [Citrobacter freundii]|nr:conjugal transfer protein TraQ [Citrobacter freundii]
LAGVGFVYAALDMFRRSELEGHTALSSSESIRAATVKLMAGTAMVFSPQLIDAALATFGLAF